MAGSDWRAACADRRVEQVLESAPVLCGAVDTGRGPHVTPTAFSWSGGALWVVTTRRSVKVRALRRRPGIGLLLRSRHYDLVAIGRASIVDPLRAGGVADPDRLVELPFAALGYLGRNSRHAVGVLRSAPGPGLLLDRLAVRVVPTRAVLLRADQDAATSTVVASWGAWTSVELINAAPAVTPTALDLTCVPAGVRSLLGGPGPGCLAWPTVHGPVAVPVHRGGNGDFARADAGLMELVGAKREGPSALAVSTGGYRLDSKRGVMLRGSGRAHRSGHRVLIDVEPSRCTYWVGDNSSTVPAVLA
jgi:hypothetical protein